MLDGGFPCLEPPDEVGGLMESQTLQGRRSEARAVALVADDDDAAALIGHLGDAVRAGGGGPPLPDVPVNGEGAGKLAVPVALLGWADVDEQGAGSNLGPQVGWVHPVQALAGG